MLFSIHIPITSFFLIISFISNIRIFFPKYHYFATIKHKKAYQKVAAGLAEKFIANFEAKYPDMPEHIRTAGPRKPGE